MVISPINSENRSTLNWFLGPNTALKGLFEEKIVVFNKMRHKV